MKSLSILQLLLATIILSSAAFSQNDLQAYYDFDPVLFNGRVYSFYMPYNTKGHPYLQNQDFKTGYVIIREKSYDNILLNYDIYNQKLVLKYKNPNGTYEFMVLSNAWLEKFNIHNQDFELVKSDDGQERFFQVIGEDSLRVLYYWEKDLELSAGSGGASYYITEPFKTMYLYRDEEFYKFRNNKDFINYFNPMKKDQVKEYLKQNRIRIKKTSDEIMNELIRYSNKI